MRRRLDLAGVKVCITAMKKPVVAEIDGDAAVARRVAKEGHHQDLWRQPREVAYGLKAMPRLTHMLMGYPLGAMGPELTSIARRLTPARRLSLAKLCGIYMHFGLWKVADPADMIGVEMCTDDVTDIPG